MPASARTARTLLNVETLEGRAMPAGIVAPPILANAAIATQLGPGANLASVPVVTRVFVNGERVMRVSGRVAFSAIGPAVSTDANGHSVETGGTTIFANGHKLGTFERVRSMTKTVEFCVNQDGTLTRVITFRMGATPHAAAALAFHGGPHVG